MTASAILVGCLLLLLSGIASAAPPIVSTVPVDPNDPILPHDVISGKPTTLKGAVDDASAGATWTWDPGDGSPSTSGIVDPYPTGFAQTDDAGFTPPYAIWIEHTYVGQDGDIFLATLTVDNGIDEPVAAVYRVEVRDKTLPVEVNASIDEALWFMHRNQFRFNGAISQSGGSSVGSVPMLKWDFQQTAGIAQASATATAINAFEANGYLETGPASSPYTETVARGLRYVIASVKPTGISSQSYGRPAGLPDDPDGNGNGIGLLVSGTQPNYQSGMIMDAIIASGTPDAAAVTGPANVLGRSYGDIVQDMVDYYAYAQGDGPTTAGWVYSAANNSAGGIDNSVSGWAAIGLLAAEDVFGSTVPQWVKDRNPGGLELTDTASNTSSADGQHGYTNSPSPAWGGFGVTGAAMVQMSMDDIASTTSATPDERWIRAENYFRRYFSQGFTGNNFRNYYYAMFNFAKAMRTAVPQEVVVIGVDNSVGCGPNGGVPGCGPTPAPLDWYSDPGIGLARTMVDFQTSSGNNIGMFTDRPGNSQGSYQDEHNTSWATQILTRTLFRAGPVARASASPNPGAANAPIVFDSSASFHQDPARSLVSFEWDFDDDGSFDAFGPVTTFAFDCPTLPVPCTYPVRLRVTDDNVPSLFDEDVLIVEITVPPRPPTADAGGPYLACVGETVTLDGSASYDVDEGTSETGNAPFDGITAYAWELDGVSPFDFAEATGVEATASFATVGTRDVGLRVTDNTAAAFPIAGLADLTDSDFSRVDVVDCSCMGPITVRSKPGKNQLVWSPVAGAEGYDIQRGTRGPSQGLSILAADHVTDYATFLDKGLTNGQTYWYRVTPLGADGNPICASSLAAWGTPQTSRRGGSDLVLVPDVTGISESEAVNRLAGELLNLGAKTFEPSATVAEGLVISQDPAVGVRVAEGSTVSIVVSTGPVRVEVPDVIGLPQAEAETTIVGAGLTVGDLTSEHSDTVPAGSVISQDPFGGLLVVEGGAVNLIVSLGPQTTLVPPVIGETQADAEALILAASLTVGSVVTENSDTVPEGSVIDQAPPGSTEVVLGTPVDLVVSLGPTTAPTPNLIGLPGTEAEAAIVAAGFVVGQVTSQFSTTVPEGTVITQTPGVGSPLLPGATIDLVISLGAPQVQVPNVVGSTQTDAEAALAAAALSVGDVTGAFSLAVPAGVVISQDPAAGSTADESSPVSLVVSLGPRQVDVPNVIGQDQATAASAIVSAGLVVGLVTETVSLTQPPGSVVSQNPVGGVTVDEQSAVALVVAIADTTGALVNIVLEPAVADPDEPVLVTIEAVDDSGVAPALEVTIGGSPFALDANNQGLFTSANPGVFEVVATATDGSGNASQATAEIRVRDPNDTTPPIAILSDPLDLAEVSFLTDLVGTASDDNLLRYQLGYRRPGDASFTIFAEGGSNVEDAALATFDPTLLQNGQYRVRLVVEDANGLASIDEKTYRVTGGAKIGVFSLSWIDMQVPVSGIPISIIRTYDSRVKTSEDFGFGWTLDVRQGAIEHNRVPGDGWTITASGGFFPLPCQVVNETKQHLTTISLSDREHYDFELRLDQSASIFGGCVAEARYVFADGTADGATLQILDGSQVFFPNGTDQLQNAGTFLPFEPRRVRLTTADGRVVDLDADQDGITRISDANGNQLTIDDSGISHSSGLSIAFVRDAAGRITSITDPAGEQIVYSYDASGDLIDYTDRAGVTTEFDYVAPHLLTEIRDPLGNRAVRNEFDEDGRLVATIDALGNRLAFTHDLGSRREVTQDRLGAVTVFEYDELGNVIAETDALGNRTEYTSDDRGNTLTVTDPLGRIFSTTYEGNNRTLTRTDFDGNAISITRDTGGRMLSRTDDRGRVSTMSYDADGNLLSATDGNGATTAYTVDVAGRVTAITDPLGAASSFAYDADGNLTSMQNPVGVGTTFAYNANGRPVATTRSRTLPDGSTETVTTETEYDNSGRITAIVDGLGFRKELVYDGGGQVSEVTSNLGVRTVYERDLNGNLTEIRFEDGSSRSFTYDAEDQLLAETDRDGEVTRHQYDALGRRTRTTHPDGASVQWEYDAVGRVTSETDELGRATMISYAAGRKDVTDPLGNVTRFEYDGDGPPVRVGPEGNVTRMTDALGNVTTFDYDLGADRHGRAREIGVTLADGTTVTKSHDARGKLTGVTDQLGATTAFQYDEVARLTGVSEACVAETTYGYDEFGNRTSVTDANGNETRYEYDALGHLIRRTLPLGQSESFGYDGSGNLLTHVRFSGDVVRYGYDARGRLTSLELPGEAPVAYSYTADGLRTAAGGESYTYDSRGRLSSETKASGESLAYTYDAAGNRLTMATPAGTTSYTYDALDRPVRVTDAASGETNLAYDALGNLIQVEHADGTVTQHTYDAVSRIVSTETRDSSGTLLMSMNYTRDAVGKVTRVAEQPVNRVVQYAYDDCGRLVSEIIDDPAAGTVTRSYLLDKVGNVLELADSAAGTTSYQYDANNRLVRKTDAAGETLYGYDANGNQTSVSGPGGTVTSEYDALNRLARRDDGATETLHAYDPDGALMAITTDGVERRLLVDKNRRLAQIVAEQDDQGAVLASYVHVDRPISMTRGGQSSYYQVDGLGDVRLLTDATGSVTDRYDYLAYGDAASVVGATDNPLRFRGEYAVDEGLYYQRARFYDAADGRFVSMDPVQGVDVLPLSFNPYLLALADPVNFRDPTGRFFMSSISVAISIAGVLAAISVEIYFSPPGEDEISTTKRKVNTRIADSYATAALIYMSSGYVESVDQWFGEKADHKKIEQVYTDAVMESGWIQYVEDDSCGTGEIAWVSGFGGDTIHLCSPRFFDMLVLPTGDAYMDATISGQGGSQMTTIVHELSHMAGTEDVVDPLCGNNKCYGRQNARKLGEQKPAAAVENASNYEFQVGDFYHSN